VARPAQRHHIDRARGFDFITPLQDQCICVDDAGTVEVAVKDRSGDTYVASISVFSGGATGALLDQKPLVQEGSTNRFSARLSVGDVSNPPEGNNRFVSVESSEGEIEEHPFRAIRCGSGSSCSGSEELLLARRCPHCRIDQPVPVAVQLRLAPPVAGGGFAQCEQLKRPADLVHCRQPGFECCWLSAPLDLGGGGTDPGFWLLEKADDTTWLLVLGRGRTRIVRYRLTTRVAGDCSFPITLDLVDPDDGENRHWPRTVTIIPAP
jgi:hypothetical protein